MSNEQWITFDDGVQLVRARMDASIGRAEAVMRAAKASGEVRTKYDGVVLLNDDGAMGWNLKPGSTASGGKPHVITGSGKRLFSRDDLLDWLSRHHTEAAASPEPKPRAQNKRSRVAIAIQELWPDGLPDQSVLSNSLLFKKVGNWLKSDCQKQNVPVAIPSDDTILRAAGRK
jgi:hypothetical protein